MGGRITDIIIIMVVVLTRDLKQKYIIDYEVFKIYNVRIVHFSKHELQK